MRGWAYPLSSPPRIAVRCYVSLAVALFAASIAYVKHLQFPNHPPDFGVAWFGAQSILNGSNPYALVGPGLVYDWPWKLQYPATAFVAALPFAVLPEIPAAVLFVALSAGALAFGLTADGWYRLPLFATTSFVAAAAFAQWSILFSAAICLAPLGMFFAAKPNLALAIVASEPAPVGEVRPGVTRTYILVGAILLLSASLILLPGWPSDWIAAIRSSDQLVPPILLPAGPLVLTALFRWRRWEARLILAMSLIPQTTYWYEALPLFLIPSSLAESVALALVASVGMLLEQHVIAPATEVEHYRQIGNLMVGLIYFPAALMLLRRPNVGTPPSWWRFLRRPQPAQETSTPSSPSAPPASTRQGVAPHSRA